MDVTSIDWKYRTVSSRHLKGSAALLWVWLVSAIPALASGISVAPDTPEDGRWTVTTPAYRMVINLESPRIDSFEAGDHPLISQGIGLAPTINTGAPWGPAKATVAMEGPAVTHIVLYGMRWEKELTGDIQVHFFCYPNRVVARMDIIPRAAPPILMLGWVGTVTHAAPFPVDESAPDWHEALNVDGKLAPAALLLPPLLKGVDGRRRAHVRIDRGSMVNAHFVHYTHAIGTRSVACMLLAAKDETALLELLGREVSARQMRFDVTNGRHLGYDETTGMQRFIIKPGWDPITITVAKHEDSAIAPFIAAVASQRREPISVNASPSNAADIPWMQRTFDASDANGPGAYIMLFETGPDSQTLRLQRIGNAE